MGNVNAWHTWPFSGSNGRVNDIVVMPPASVMVTCTTSDTKTLGSKAVPVKSDQLSLQQVLIGHWRKRP